jgi:glycolate oxidase iron-sulfur subunit
MQVKDLEEALLRCMKCGECQAVCPSFSVTRRESEAARGKVHLIKALCEGELKPSKALMDRLSTCLLCKACSATCPSGVKVDQLIIAAREELVNKLGLPLYKMVFFRLLEHPGTIPLGMGCAKLLGLLPRQLPSPKKPFRRQVSSRPKLRNPRSKVVFFAGCMINYAYPEVGIAVMDVLNKDDFEVEVKEEKCCGIPALYSGDVERARANAESNLKNFTGDETIVTACPTCALAWKEYPKLLTGEAQKKASELASKTFEISDFFLKYNRKELGDIGATLTYHQPCHLTYGLGVRHEPRELVRLVGKGEYVEIEDKCCGFGGLFSYEHPEIAEKINDEKIDDIAESGAELVVTPCPGCKYQINAGLKRRGLSKRTLHTAELLSMAVKSGG